MGFGCNDIDVCAKTGCYVMLRYTLREPEKKGTMSTKYCDCHLFFVVVGYSEASFFFGIRVVVLAMVFGAAV